MPASEVRKEARESLKGKWSKAAIITLVYLAYSFIIDLIAQHLESTPALSFIFFIAVTIISVPIAFGLTITFIKLKRGNEDVSAFDFFKDGFSRFGKSWGIWGHTLLKLIIPIICLILVIVLLISIGMISYFKTGNQDMVTSSIFLMFIAIIVYLACLIYIFSRTLLYALSYYISYDNPELSSKECVERSATYMKGNRGNLFLLMLSFIGWGFLACLTFGIGMLWLTPYIQVSIVCFYDKITSHSNTEEVVKNVE